MYVFKFNNKCHTKTQKKENKTEDDINMKMKKKRKLKLYDIKSVGKCILFHSFF